MFKSFEELKELIRQGKTNEEIIEGRLKWLESKEYESTKIPCITDKNCIYLYEGFMNNEYVSYDPADRINSFSYLVNGSYFKSIYFQILDVIRINMERGFPIAILFDLIKNYFALNEQSLYYELDQFYKILYPKNPYKLRSSIGHIISLYNHSNFHGNISEFGKLYALTDKYQVTHNEIYREAYDMFFSVVDEDFYENVCEHLIPLNQFVGAGVSSCTECSILVQNCLSFFGFKTYMLGGELNYNGKVEPHNFNLMIKDDGTSFIIDAAQLVAIPVGHIEEVAEINSKKWQCRDGIREYKLHKLVMEKSFNRK